jgi:hypothetical protein
VILCNWLAGRIFSPLLYQLSYLAVGPIENLKGGGRSFQGCRWAGGVVNVNVEVKVNRGFRLQAVR